MSELKQMPRESTLSLIEEMKEIAKDYNAESQKAFEIQGEMSEKKNLLKSAMKKTKSGMALAIIEQMIKEIETEEEELKERVNFCNNNNGYYTEIVGVLQEALKEF